MVKHVHLRDAIGQNILVVPGDGTVDFAAFACALNAIGYGGAAVIELEYEEARPGGPPRSWSGQRELSTDFAVT